MSPTTSFLRPRSLSTNLNEAVADDHLLPTSSEPISLDLPETPFVQHRSEPPQAPTHPSRRQVKCCSLRRSVSLNICRGVRRDVGEREGKEHAMLSSTSEPLLPPPSCSSCFSRPHLLRIANLRDQCMGSEYFSARRNVDWSRRSGGNAVGRRRTRLAD